MVDRVAAAKFEILRQIHELARVQREALEHDNLDRFQHILDQREELIARLTGRTKIFPTAAVAQIQLSIDSWEALRSSTRGRLVNLWRPKELVASGR